MCQLLLLRELEHAKFRNESANITAVQLLETRSHRYTAVFCVFIGCYVVFVYKFFIKTVTVIFRKCSYDF